MTTAALLDGSGHMWRALPLPRWTLRAITGACLLLVGIVLATSRGMYRAGLAGPRTLNQALRLSSRLTQVSLRAWRLAVMRNRP
jgi:hypothetical protein